MILLPRHAPAEEDHPTRQAILRVVRESPGIPLNKLRSQLPTGWGTLYHHVRRLVKRRELETLRAGRRRVLYVPGGILRHQLEARALLHGTTVRRIAEIVEAQPKISFKRLSELTGETERVTYYHLKRLMEAGLVESASQSRHYGLMATPSLSSCLRTPAPAAPHNVPATRQSEPYGEPHESSG